MRRYSIPIPPSRPARFHLGIVEISPCASKIYPPQAISFFSKLPQKICFAKILREEERPAAKRVKVCLRTFTANRLRRDESGERSPKIRRLFVFSFQRRRVVQIATTGEQDRRECTIRYTTKASEARSRKMCRFQLFLSAEKGCRLGQLPTEARRERTT